VPDGGVQTGVAALIFGLLDGGCAGPGVKMFPSVLPSGEIGFLRADQHRAYFIRPASLGRLETCAGPRGRRTATRWCTAGRLRLRPARRDRSEAGGGNEFGSRQLIKKSRFVNELQRRQKIWSTSPFYEAPKLKTPMTGGTSIAVNTAFRAIPSPAKLPAISPSLSLYQIEGEIRGHSADDRCAVRREKSQPILQAFEPWLRAKLALISQKTKLAEAIRYALSRWNGLCRFVDDGRIEIDSNVVERAIRPIALNRKNALFAGSDGGAEHWAVIASLIETCKLTDVEPHAYLAETITKIVNGHPNSRLDELLPWTYPAATALKHVA
jgi:Transposase IS66 family/IS66 C-terminal element